MYVAEDCESCHTPESPTSPPKYGSKPENNYRAVYAFARASPEEHDENDSYQDLEERGVKVSQPGDYTYAKSSGSKQGAHSTSYSPSLSPEKGPSKGYTPEKPAPALNGGYGAHYVVPSYHPVQSTPSYAVQHKSVYPPPSKDSKSSEKTGSKDSTYKESA